MASNSHCSFLFLLSLTFILHQSSSSQLTQNATDPIHEVCNQTAYNDFCVASLESDPWSSTGDLNVFADILIRFALSNVTNTYPYISKLYNETAEPILKDCLHLCLLMYEEAVYDLQDALTSLGAMDYNLLHRDMGATLDDAVTCSEYFSTLPVHKWPLTQQTLVLIQLSKITLAIDDMLAGSSKNT